MLYSSTFRVGISPRLPEAESAIMATSTTIVLCANLALKSNSFTQCTQVLAVPVLSQQTYMHRDSKLQCYKSMRSQRESGK